MKVFFFLSVLFLDGNNTKNIQRAVWSKRGGEKSFIIIQFLFIWGKGWFLTTVEAGGEVIIAM